MHLDRIGDPLDRNGAERLRVDVALGEPQRLAGEPDRARRGELLHATGQMRRLANRGVVHSEIASDRAHDDLSRVEADANQDFHALGAAKILGIAPDRLLHGERGVAGAHRMVLVGERGSEESHDAVAHDLIHRALKAMDRVHHSLEYRVEDSPRLFGIPVRQELHRALHVGEEDGDLLALTFEGGARMEDALGEVMRRVRFGCGSGAGAGKVGRMGALRAELSSRWEPGPAASAARLER